MKTKISLLILLFVACSAIVIVYKSTLRAYDQYNDLRLDPIGLSLSEKFNFDSREYEIVLIGDSHVANWKIPEIDVLNLGIPSQTSHQVLLRSDMLKDAIKGNLLVILVGANDIKSIMTNKTQKDEIVAHCAQNIYKIATTNTQNFNKVIIVTVPPIFHIPKEYWSLYDKSIADAITELNVKIKSICDKNDSFYLLDANKIMKEKSKDVNVSSDGVHLNKAGYDYLNKLLTTQYN